MESLKLNIYDKKGKEIIKTYEAQTYDLTLGTIKKIMEVLKIDNMDNKGELVKNILGAWEEVIDVLSNVFPECTKEEWNNVKLKELIPVIIDVAKYSILETFKIPTEKN